MECKGLIINSGLSLLPFTGTPGSRRLVSGFFFFVYQAIFICFLLFNTVNVDG